MSQEQSPEDKLKAVFANPTTRSAVASALASPRPQGWGRKSIAPYYKKEYAEEIKVHIDKQLESGGDIILRYSVWCPFHNISERTLYNRVNQGIMFLCERLDPEGKYTAWYQSSEIDTKRNRVGILITMPKGKIGQIPPEIVVPKEELPKWRKQLDEWLESDEQEPFVKEHLALGPDEMKLLRDELEHVEGIMADVKSSKVSVVKL